MSFCERFSEQFQLIDVLYGDNVNGTTESNTGANLIENFARVVVIIHPVDINDNLDVDVEQAATAAGALKTVDANSKDVTIATTDTKPTVIEIRAEELDVTNRYCYLNIEVTTAGTNNGGNEFVVEIWGEPAYKPADTTNLDSVTD